MKGHNIEGQIRTKSLWLFLMVLNLISAGLDFCNYLIAKKRSEEC